LVSGWADQSGFGNNASQSVAGSRPSYSNTLNGRPVITFDGTADHLRVDSLSSLFNGNDTPVSIFTVVKNSFPVATNQVVFGAFNSASTNYYHIHSILNLNRFVMQRRAVFPDSTIAEPSTLITGQVNVLSSIFRGTTVDMYINGVGQTGLALNVGTFGSNVNRVSIGARVASLTDLFFGGDVAEILIYNNAVTTNDAIKIQEYLRKRWQ
jgi:hypothetical protein